MGCGTGFNLLWVARTICPGLVVGCDYTFAALNWRKLTLRNTGAEAPVTPALSQGDVQYLPFADGIFELLTILDVPDQFPL